LLAWWCRHANVPDAAKPRSGLRGGQDAEANIGEADGPKGERQGWRE